MKQIRLRSIILFAVLLTACANDFGGFDGDSRDSDTSSSVDTSSGQNNDDSVFPYPLEIDSIEWFPCSLWEGEDDGRAQCADLPLPLYWRKKDPGTFDVYAKRLLGDGTGKTQLWLLQGGPGGSGVFDFPGWMETLQGYDSSLDIYTVDHRGTGYSSRLSCPEQEAEDSLSGTAVNPLEIPDCLDVLEQTLGGELSAYRTTDAAIDLAAYIHLSREPEKNVIVLGGSYGTYWAERYLAIFPDQADGVILAGITPPDSTMADFDEYANKTGEEFMRVCALDDLCRSRLGDDPWAALGDLHDKLNTGHCGEAGLTSSRLALLLAYLLYYHPGNSAVPAAIYRLLRCEEGDPQAIEHLWNRVLGAGGTWDLASYSILTQHHVSLSEMWDHSRFDGVLMDEYFFELASTVYIGKHLGQIKQDIREIWPIYHDLEWDDVWPETDIPVLMLQGRLDPATHWQGAKTVGDHLNGPNQIFVTFEEGAHSVIKGSPVSSSGDRTTCGMDLVLRFAAAPSLPLDTSCVENVLPINFAGTEELSLDLFGTSDFWDNDELSF